MALTIPAITNAQLMLTNQCQLRCKYCYENRTEEKVSLETAKAVADYLAANAEANSLVPRISFFGGEPLLRFEDIILPLVAYIREKYKRYEISMVTNGLLLDEDKLEYLKQQRIPFMLSVDGCQQAQDANRVYADGSGSFADLEPKFPMILKYFPMTTARVTLTPENLPYLYESVQYLASVGFVDLHVVPNVLQDWSNEDYEVLARQMDLIRDYMIAAFENDEVPLVFTILGQMFPKMVVAKYEEEHDRYRQTPSSIPRCRCGVGLTGKAEIDMYGNMFTCFHCSMKADTSEPLYIGNIQTGVIEEQIEKLVAMNEETPLHGGDCENCALNRICSGGCVPNNYLLFGDFNRLPDIYCKWMQSVYHTACELVAYFDKAQTNDLFKDFFYGQVKRGVCAVC